MGLRQPQKWIKRSFCPKAPKSQTLILFLTKSLTTTLIRTLSSPDISRHLLPGGQEEPALQGELTAFQP